MEESDEVQSKVKVTATDRKSPGENTKALVNVCLSLCLCLNRLFSVSVITDSPHYSEDFEEENSEEALKEVCSWML